MYIPVCTSENFYCTWYRICFPSIGLHTDSASMFNAKKMIHHFKSFLAFGEVNTANIHKCLKLALCMVAQECKDRDDGRRCDIES